VRIAGVALLLAFSRRDEARRQGIAGAQAAHAPSTRGGGGRQGNKRRPGEGLQRRLTRGSSSSPGTHLAVATACTLHSALSPQSAPPADPGQRGHQQKISSTKRPFPFPLSLTDGPRPTAQLLLLLLLLFHIFQGCCLGSTPLFFVLQQQLAGGTTGCLLACSWAGRVMACCFAVACALPPAECVVVVVVVVVVDCLLLLLCSSSTTTSRRPAVCLQLLFHFLILFLFWHPPFWFFVLAVCGFCHGRIHTYLLLHATAVLVLAFDVCLFVCVTAVTLAILCMPSATRPTHTNLLLCHHQQKKIAFCALPFPDTEET
jgi:hypothetical protein